MKNRPKKHQSQAAKEKSQSPPLPEPGPKDRVFQLWLFVLSSLVAAVLRIVYLVPLRGEVLFDEPHRDSIFYVDRAREILAGDWLGSTVSFHSAPHYPYFLAAIMGLTGTEGLWWVRIVQAILSALTVGFLGLSAFRLFGRGAAVVTVILSMFYAPLIFYAGELLEITLTLFFLSVAAWMLTREKLGSAGTVLTGASLGLAAIGKPNLLLLAPVMLIYFGFLRPLSKPSQWPWRQGIMLLLGLFIVILPFTIRNKVVGDDWVLISSNGGINLFIGNNPTASGGFFVPTAMQYDLEASSLRVAEEGLGKSLKPSEASRFWLSRSWAFFTKRPGQAARNFLKKTGLLLNHYEIPNHFNIYFFRDHFSKFLRWPLVWYHLLLPLAGLGLVFALRRSRPSRFAAWAALVVGASVVLFFVTSRYRTPVLIWLLPFAGAGVMSLFRLIRERRWRLLPVPILILVALAALVRLPLVPKQDYHEDFITIGNYWATKQDWERVIEYNEKALAENEKSAPAWQNRGYAYMELARNVEDMDKAEECLWKAISLDPFQGHAYGNLASFYFRVNRPYLSEPCLKKALEIDPGLTERLRELGQFLVLKKDGYRERAELLLQRIEKGLDEKPGDPVYLMDKAEIYGMRLEDYDKALEILADIPAQAVEQDSTLARGYHALKRRLLVVKHYTPLLNQNVPRQGRGVRPRAR